MIEKETAVRVVANTLPVARAISGPRIANYIETTPPDERTWTAGAAVLALGATDKADGTFARAVGATKLGGWLDQMADKAFVIPGQMALQNNGELSAIHPRLKIVRDAGVSALRLYAASQEKDVSAGGIGKQKTFTEMLTLAASCSPISRNPDHIRAGASLATALSMTSLADYLIDYTIGNKSKPGEEVTARNSKPREVTAGPIDRLVTVIDEKAPFISPDHLTEAGKALVITANVMAVKNPDNPALATALYTLGSLLDTLDGSLARKKDETPTDKGMLKDVRSDKLQEIITFSALSLIARSRKNNVAADNYAVATMSAVLPALFRARAENRGVIVAEGGIGTRVGRGILGGVGMALNRNQDVSDIVSATVAANNVITAEGRRQVVKLREESPYYKGDTDQGIILGDGNVKQKALKPLAAAGVAVGAALLLKKRR